MTNKKFIFAILFLFIISFAGCSTISSEINHMDPIEEFDYLYNFENGLQIGIKKNKIDENLISFEFNLHTESSVYNKFEFVSLVDGASKCYLLHNDTGEKIIGFGDLETNILFFDDIDYSELSEYTLHFECPIDFEMNVDYSVKIHIPDRENVFENNIIELPFENFIGINELRVRTGFDRFSDKCVDVDFITSSNVTSFDIRIDKSEISTGAAIGDLTDHGNNKYTYTHPITENEKEIVMLFDKICINDLCEFDIEL